ncbi:CHASE domain-containing protein [Consotaella salsifontis]|uniref:histidine kinase n=1 Tax=Consotaella salsifontis TaxID=1365950 RepID=A0A1T4NZ96_9HYPH|nr:CHASE domain-containing protein [Consotaella salsifontis]SJZ84499.1 sensor domain CHASE1-containing protein [Consotaella salsifontis]
MRKYLVPAAILVVSCAFALALAALVWRSGTDGDRLRFDGFADDAVGRIGNRISLHMSLLEATRAHLRVTNELRNKDAFSAYVSGLDLSHRYGGIQGIGYAEAVRAGDTAEAASFLSSTYNIETGVWPAETDQPVRTPILLLEPQDRRNQAAMGYDMLSNPVRREAMVRAAREDTFAATGPVELVQEIDENRQAGFLVYLPLETEGASADAGKAVLLAKGFVYAPFRAGDFITAALSSGSALPLKLRLYDSRIAPEQLLFDSTGAGPFETTGDFRTFRRIDFGGRNWIVDLAPGEDFSRTASDLPAVLLAVLGVALSILLSALAFLQARRAEAVAALAAASAESLAQKDLLLREMNHRIKNSITRMLAMARQTSRHSSDMDEFMMSYEARLGAMAKSQEILTRSGRRGATVKELLEAELGQVFGGSLQNCELCGPEVEIDEKAVQALGLTFHELATNALKYGAIAEDDGTLTVVWSLTAGEIAIEWMEKGAERPERSEPVRKGFGTRLIEMNIERELGGRIERNFAASGLTVALRFPQAASIAANARPKQSATVGQA